MVFIPSNKLCGALSKIEAYKKGFFLSKEHQQKHSFFSVNAYLFMIMRLDFMTCSVFMRE